MTVAVAAASQSMGRIHAILGSLIRERQTLREDNRHPALLEANRLAIVYWQQELARTLDATHGTSKTP